MTPSTIPVVLAGLGLNETVLVVRAEPRSTLSGAYQDPTVISAAALLLDEVAETIGVALDAYWGDRLSRPTESDRDGQAEWRAATNGHATPIRRLRLESPLEIVVEVPAILFTSLPAVGLMIFLAKQLWRIDLDLKISRRLGEAELSEATQLAQRAAAGEMEAIWGPELSERAAGLLAPKDVRWEATVGAVVDWDELDWL